MAADAEADAESEDDFEAESDDDFEKDSVRSERGAESAAGKSEDDDFCSESSEDDETPEELDRRMAQSAARNFTQRLYCSAAATLPQEDSEELPELRCYAGRFVQASEVENGGQKGRSTTEEVARRASRWRAPLVNDRVTVDEATGEKVLLESPQGIRVSLTVARLPMLADGTAQEASVSNLRAKRGQARFILADAAGTGCLRTALKEAGAVHTSSLDSSPSSKAIVAEAVVDARGVDKETRSLPARKTDLRNGKIPEPRPAPPEFLEVSEHANLHAAPPEAPAENQEDGTVAPMESIPDWAPEAPAEDDHEDEPPDEPLIEDADEDTPAPAEITAAPHPVQFQDGGPQQQNPQAARAPCWSPKEALAEACVVSTPPVGLEVAHSFVNNIVDAATFSHVFSEEQVERCSLASEFLSEDHISAIPFNNKLSSPLHGDVDELHPASDAWLTKNPPDDPPECDVQAQTAWLTRLPPCAPLEEEEADLEPPEERWDPPTDSMPSAPAENPQCCQREGQESFSKVHDYDGPVRYPGLDELLNDPEFRCREEWKRKLVPAQPEPDEPLTFQHGTNRQPPGQGRVGWPRAPAQPKKVGKHASHHHSARTVPVVESKAERLDLEEIRNLIGPRTLRAPKFGGSCKPLDVPIRQSASHETAHMSRSPSPPPVPVVEPPISQRAKEFSRCYLPDQPRTFRRVHAHGFRKRQVQGGEAFAHARLDLGYNASSDEAKNKTTERIILPPLMGKVSSSALQAWAVAGQRGVVRN